MTTPTQSNTVSLLRILKAPPARVYRAFVEPEAKIRWEPPFGFLGKIHAWDCRVGGRYRISFINFATGTTHTFGGEFLELVENEKIVVTDAFEDPNLTGTVRMTVQLRAVLNGTELRIEQRGLPAVIPPELCYAGWQESLVQLAQLVEAAVPDDPAACPG
ncbi:MAG: SRPBCC family protein [Rhodocyclaceae bacterium]|nr:SRPBCC family protein [Rhodocyclaceae bacterium]